MAMFTKMCGFACFAFAATAIAAGFYAGGDVRWPAVFGGSGLAIVGFVLVILGEIADDVRRIRFDEQASPRA